MVSSNQGTAATTPHIGRGMTDVGDGSGGGVMGDRGVNVSASTVMPTDRVRWGPIIAGLFAALSSLVVLSVLGAAVAGSTFDPGDRARTYGIGAGVWGTVSMLLAFLIGGWLAARSAAVRGRGNGVLNGAMVWVVAIPLMIYLISAAMGAATRAAAGVAQTGVQAANVAAQADPSSVQQAKGQAQQAAQSPQVQGQANAMAQKATDPANQERAADAVKWGAWGTLAALLLSLGAAALGGSLGARTDDRMTVAGGPAAATA